MLSLTVVVLYESTNPVSQLAHSLFYVQIHVLQFYNPQKRSIQSFSLHCLLPPIPTIIQYQSNNRTHVLLVHCEPWSGQTFLQTYNRHIIHIIRQTRSYPCLTQ